MKERLTHLDEAGRARMVDVGDKQTTHREAIAHGRIRMQPETLRRALAGDLPKGDVRAIAEIAGVMAGKRTSDLIPLCHPLALTSLRVDVKPDETGLALAHPRPGEPALQILQQRPAFLRGGGLDAHMMQFTTQPMRAIQMMPRH